MYAKIFFYPVFIVLLKLIIFVSEITGKICALIYFYKDGSIEQNCILNQGLAKWYRIGIIEPDHIGEFPSRSGIDLKWFGSVKILLSVEETDTYKKPIRIEITCAVTITLKKSGTEFQLRSLLVLFSRFKAKYFK